MQIVCVCVCAGTRMRILYQLLQQNLTTITTSLKFFVCCASKTSQPKHYDFDARGPDERERQKPGLSARSQLIHTVYTYRAQYHKHELDSLKLKWHNSCQHLEQ